MKRKGFSAILTGCNNSESAGFLSGNSTAESSSSSIGSASVSESGDIFCFEFSIDGET